MTVISIIIIIILSLVLYNNNYVIIITITILLLLLLLLLLFYRCYHYYHRLTETLMELLQGMNSRYQRRNFCAWRQHHQKGVYGVCLIHRRMPVLVPPVLRTYLLPALFANSLTCVLSCAHDYYLPCFAYLLTAYLLCSLRTLFDMSARMSVCTFVSTDVCVCYVCMCVCMYGYTQVGGVDREFATVS